MDELGVSVWRAKLFLRFKFEGSNLVMNDSVHQILLFPSFDRFCMDQGIWLKALKFAIPVHIDFGLRFQNI